MKKIQLLIPIMFLAILTSCSDAKGQQDTKDQKVVKKVIRDYVNAGDEQDADELASYLDDNYRVVFFDPSSKTVIAMTKDGYVKNIREKKFGGDNREVVFEEVLIYDGKNAVVKVQFNGKMAKFKTFVSLIKTDNGWKVLQDQPLMEIL